MDPTFTWGILDQAWYDAIISGFRLDFLWVQLNSFKVQLFNCRKIGISIRNYLIRLRLDSLSSDVVMWWQTDVCSVFGTPISVVSYTWIKFSFMYIVPNLNNSRLGCTVKGVQTCAENQLTVFSTHFVNTTWWEPSKTKGKASKTD